MPLAVNRTGAGAVLAGAVLSCRPAGGLLPAGVVLTAARSAGSADLMTLSFHRAERESARGVLLAPFCLAALACLRICGDRFMVRDSSLASAAGAGAPVAGAGACGGSLLTGLAGLGSRT
jgi:hypothetical protein